MATSARVYGKQIPAKDIVRSETFSIPLAAEKLISTRDARTPRRRS
jgi:hypothetical protein